MGWVNDNFFGGAERRAGRVQSRYMSRAMDDLENFYGQGREQLNQGFGEAETFITDYLNRMMGEFERGEGVARNELNRGYGTALGDLTTGANRAMDQISQQYGGAIDRFNPYAETGGQANQLVAALSGALGQEAQAEAYNNFQESPAAQFQREMGERAVMRNASQGGQIGSGALLTDLNQFGQGLANQEFGNYYNRLAGQQQMGMQAAGAQAGLQSQQGNQLANILQQLGQGQAGIRMNQGTALANLVNNYSGMRAQAYGNTGQQLSGLRSGLSQLISNSLFNQGGSVANLRTGQGQALASGILDSAGAVRGTVESLYNMANDAGSDVMNPFTWFGGD